MPNSSEHTLLYGQKPIHFTLPGIRYCETLDIQPTPPIDDPTQTILAALDTPIGQDRPFSETLTPGDTIAIIVSDSFRQTRADQILPTLLDYLNQHHIPDDHISITYSTGTHRAPTPEEQQDILGPKIFQRMQGRLHTHDPLDKENLIHLGTTSRGTPVSINRHVHEHTHVIATGACVLHYFGGFGGGRKSIVPGIASIHTIAHNHAMNLHPQHDQLDPNVSIGRLQGNPVAEDMLEATQLTHVELIINTVLNRDDQIAGLFCGDLIQAHQTACAFASKSFQVPLQEKADLVIAASPSTKNFVQTHKALFNAWQALKPGGQIILLAPCPEGIGGDNFKKWLLKGDRANIIQGLRHQSEINGQTALSTREKSPSTILITQMSHDDVALLGATKSPDLQTAIQQASHHFHRQNITNPTTILMPNAPYTVPKNNS